MAALGDKVACKKLAKKAKVPTVPGSDGAVDDEKIALKIAQDIGYPVIIKAAAGGGGRGMRVAHNDVSLRAGIKQAPGKGARARALSGEGRLAGRRVVLARPTTYMNESGGPVRGLLDYHHIDPADLLVVHDELDIPFAAVRLKRGGGEGGHNGLRSITRSVGTKDYLRVRVGIGRPPGRQDPADFVLKDFSATERKELELLVAEAADAAELLLERGLEAAQNVVHPRS